MTSQSQIEDEILAKRLQSEEFKSSGTTPARNSQVISDEEYARRLDRLERQNSEPRVVVSFSNKPTVKLLQTVTGRQIGELMIVNNFGPDEIALELSNRRGYFLRIRDTGTVEFNIPSGGAIDDFFRFRLFALSNGSCYLLSKAFLHSTNRGGGKGWYLTILPNGQLCGNGNRDTYSEWGLINIATNQSIFAPTNAVVLTSTPATTYFAGATPQPPPPPPSQFPGLGAGKDELMRYFSTPAGIQFLNQPEYQPAYQLYQRNGLLSRLLHRPDWPYLATKFRDYYAEPLPFRKELVDQAITFESLKQFFELGWTTVSNCVTPESLVSARKIINYWQFKYLSQPNQGFNGLKKQRGYSVELTGDIAWDMDLLGLYYRSPLPQIMQELLGPGEVEHPKFCRSVLVYPSLDLTESPELFGDKWTIQGFTSNPPSHSPFNILIGIALTDITDTEMGNFCVHSGSHVVLLEEYKNKAERGLTLFSEDPYTVSKPDLGLPTQLKLKAGDAFLCTQRLATLFSTNTKSDPTMFAFFEISNIDHAVLKDPALQSMWLEYKNASQYLSDENAGIIISPAEAVPLESLSIGKESGTIASPASHAMPATATATAISPAGVMFASSAMSPLSRSNSKPRTNEEEFTPSMNPMFSSGGYANVSTEDEDFPRESVGPARPSNMIPLQTFTRSPSSSANTNHTGNSSQK